MVATEESAERQIFCSACFEVVPESRVNVIPFYNADARGYVTTYRCDRCWIASLDETRARLAATADEGEVASAAEFFERHGVFIHEFRRGDPAATVKDVIGQVLDKLRSGALRLAVGPIAALPEKLDYRPTPPPFARHVFSGRRVLKGVALAAGLLVLLLLAFMLFDWLQRGP